MTVMTGRHRCYCCWTQCQYQSETVTSTCQPTTELTIATCTPQLNRYASLTVAYSYRFITFTCNPQWSEIRAELFPHQSPADRHDIFCQKVIAMLRLLTNDSVFGEAQCYIYSMEWQKRGLPHIHILLWLKDKLCTADIDSVISAEIPDKESDPGLYNVVTKTMMHGPRGHLNPKQSCMKDGRCTKNYPRSFVQETQSNHNRYLLYRRRSGNSGGRETNVEVKNFRSTIAGSFLIVRCCQASSRRTSTSNSVTQSNRSSIF